LHVPPPGHVGPEPQQRKYALPQQKPLEQMPPVPHSAAVVHDEMQVAVLLPWTM
jgi:hypothetical protein